MYKGFSFNQQALINDILDLSKIEARKMELLPTEFHFPGFIEGVAELSRIRAEQKDIAFTYEPEKALPVGILADEKRLRQVLINLLGNAIKFTDKGGVTLIVEVINQENQPDFSRDLENLSLNLSPCRRETLNFPPTLVGKLARGLGQSLAFPDDVKSQVSLLEPLGFEVMEASNGQEGWDLAIAHHPDLVITDLMMPVMNGYELLRQLRSSELKEVVAIASSASVFESNQYESLDAGANVFLPKPVQADLLLQMLQKHLQLEWIYEQAESSIDNTVSSVSPVKTVEIVSPAKEVLQQLQTLVQDGDVQAILELAEQLAESDHKLIPFAQQIKQLASSFQIQRLETFIEQYTNNSKSKID